MSAARLLALLCAMVATSLMLAASASALGAADSDRDIAKIQRASATYQGWGYPVAESGSVTGWRWTSSGWRSATLTAGASVWIAPFGSGWSWAWRGGSWYAVHTASLTPWSCKATPASPTGAQPRWTLRSSSAPLFTYANTRTAAGTASIGTTMYPICTGAVDATGLLTYGIGGMQPLEHMRFPQPMSLVWVWRSGAWQKMYTVLPQCATVEWDDCERPPTTQ